MIRRRVVLTRKDWLEIWAGVFLIMALLPWVVKGSYEISMYVVKNYYLWVFKL